VGSAGTPAGRRRLHPIPVRRQFERASTHQRDKEDDGAFRRPARRRECGSTASFAASLVSVSMGALPAKTGSRAG
jgi:hypothetical protein